LYLSLLVYRQKQIVGHSIFWIILLLYSVICLIFSINSLGIIIPDVGPYPVSLHLYWIYYTCFYFLPGAILLFCLKYCGKTEYITPTTIILLSIIPTIFSFIRFEQFWGFFPVLFQHLESIGFLEFFHIFVYVYLYGILFVADIFLLRQYMYVSKKFRPQIIFLIIGTSIPFLIDILTDGNYLPSGMDVSISGFFLAFGVLYYEMLAYSPVFRERFFEVADTGLLVLNEKQLILDMNPVAEHLLNIPLREAFGKNPSEIPAMPPEFRSVLEQETLTDSQPHFSVSGPEKAWYNISVKWFPEKIGADGVYLIIITDITRNIILEKEVSRYTIRQYKEKEITAREIKYREFFRSSKDPILILSDRKIIECNQAALQLFGKERDEIIGENPVIFSSPVQKNQDDVTEKFQYAIVNAAAGNRVVFPWVFTSNKKDIDAEVTLKLQIYYNQDVVEMTIRELPGAYKK